MCEKSVQDISFLGKVVVGDTSWVFACDTEIRQQSSGWHCTLSSPWPKEPRTAKLNSKVMPIALSIIEGIVHLEFVPGATAVKTACMLRCCHVYRTK
jgi:hypothetical protein